MLRILHRLEDGLLVGLLALTIVLGGLQIALRNVFETGIDWVEPMLRYGVLWLGLLGALVASRENRHISIDILSRWLKGRALTASRLLTFGFTAAVCGVLAWHGGRFIALELEYPSGGFAGIPSWVLALILPACFGLMALRFACRAVLQLPALLPGREPKP